MKRRSVVQAFAAIGSAYGSMRSGYASASPAERNDRWNDERWGAALARTEAASGGRLGVAILDTGSGVQVSYRGTERFPLCSTFKALAAAAVLRQVDLGQQDLSRRIAFEVADLVPYSPITRDHAGGNGMTVGELCAAALNYSDNTAGNLLLRTLGGPAGVTRYAQSIGDSETRLDRWETALNEAQPGDPRDTTTPEAMLHDLRSIVLGPALTPPAREQMRTWLLGCRTGDARLKAGVPSDWRVGDKTGSGDHGTTNDVAVIWRPNGEPVIVAAYLTGTEASADARNATIATLGRLITEALG